MDMRMVLQVLASGMEHGDETDLGAEMARVGGDRAQRLGRCLEQRPNNPPSILSASEGHNVSLVYKMIPQ